MSESPSQLSRSRDIAADELIRLAYILGQMVNQYGHPDWSADEMLESLSDVSEQLQAIAKALQSEKREHFIDDDDGLAAVMGGETT